MCHKISYDIDNLSKRCYYDLNNTRKYNYCKSGWTPYANPDVIGKPIVIADGVDEKIELIGEEYFIYRIDEVITLDKIQEEIGELNNINYKFEDCIRLEDLKSIDCKVVNKVDLKQCKEAWRMFCEAEEYMMNKDIEIKIDELTEKKLDLEGLANG